MIARVAGLAFAALVVAGSSASAQRVVALAPLSTLGSEDTSNPALGASAELERAIAALPSTSLLTASQVTAALRRQKRPAIATCDGERPCVAELGRAVGAAVLVTGQLGGIGDARIVYLEAIDCATGKELGSTTWALGEDDPAPAVAARLLAPHTHVGTLRVRSPIPAAQVFVDGTRLPSRPEHTLSVGTHALRVTHPEVRDFVRFIEISYGKVTDVDVTLSPLPVVQRDVTTPGGSSSQHASSERPWFTRWWAVAGGGTVLAVVAGALAYSLTDGFSPDVTLPE